MRSLPTKSGHMSLSVTAMSTLFAYEALVKTVTAPRNLPRSQDSKGVLTRRLLVDLLVKLRQIHLRRTDQICGAQIISNDGRRRECWRSWHACPNRGGGEWTPKSIVIQDIEIAAVVDAIGIEVRASCSMQTPRDDTYRMITANPKHRRPRPSLHRPGATAAQSG